MPAKRSRTVRAHCHRASSPLPPSLPPPSLPPPSSSPRRSPSPLPRASSPDFPAYVMPGPAAEKALRKEQEPGRKQLNRKIVKLEKKTRWVLSSSLLVRCCLPSPSARDPGNAVLQAKLQHAREDYQDDYGAFIADKHWKKFDAERTRLLEARKTVATTGLLFPTSNGIYRLNQAYRFYYDGRQALFDKYDVDIEPKDRHSYAIGMKLEAVFHYLRLAAQARGDQDTMKRLALESFTIDLSNPYPQGDKRRADLEATYREHLRYFARSGYTVDSPLGTETKTNFQWTCHPDPDRDGFESVILNYTRGRSFKDTLEDFADDACKEAGVLPAALFYGSAAPVAM
ncbi:hypothetical protein C8F04DRAFT_1274874 [Mycena alexandri]|uniref:Uncharacterized protein n=1 Tax=Mycena alexandri TaxID=1745969 RepID=A0AAD6S4Y2_9AGAR|nr:hypothetical protein C8F04DRAFT_1274874 [Mycena alexandri]